MRRFLSLFAVVLTLGAPTGSSEVLRTPDEAFAELPDYACAPHYLAVDGIRIHNIDEGPRDSHVIFLFHGQPSWSFLYRNMVGVFTAAGYRVIAPDLVGFGRSDKPIDDGAHSYEAHIEWMAGFVRALDIRGATAFFQDWGGLIGLRVLERERGWLSRFAVGNTGLPSAPFPGSMLGRWIPTVLRWRAGDVSLDTLAADRAFPNWLGYFATNDDLEIGEIIELFTIRQLSEAEKAAYDAPFPDARYEAGPRMMPRLPTTQFGENAEVWDEFLASASYEILTLFSDQDPFDNGNEQRFQALPGATGQPHETIRPASHFLQEDRGAEIAEKIVDWMRQLDERKSSDAH